MLQAAASGLRVAAHPLRQLVELPLHDRASLAAQLAGGHRRLFLLGGNLVLLLFEIPEIQHLRPCQDALGLQQAQQAFAQQQRGETGARFIEHRLLPQHFERRRGAQLIDQQSVEGGAREDLVLAVDDDVHLEEQGEDVEKETVEVRQELAAAFLERLQRRRVDLELVEAARSYESDSTQWSRRSADAFRRVGWRAHGAACGLHSVSSMRC